MRLLLACSLSLLVACASQSEGRPRDAGAEGAGGGLALGDAAPGPICDGSFYDGAIDAGDAAAPECAGLEAGVTFSGDIAPILEGCTGELCHVAPTYKALVGARSKECCGSRLLVTPGDPNASYLLNKLSGVDMCGGERMPRGRAPLSDAEVALIVRFICEGAPDD